MPRKASKKAEAMMSTHSEKQVLLSSTPRRDIVKLLSERGPCSVADLASDMGRPADTLYYHIRLLQQNSLIAKHDTLRSSRRDKTIYALVGNREAKSNGKNRSKSPQETASLLNTADKEYEHGFGLPGAVTHGPAINVLADRRVAWLTDDELDSLKKHLALANEKMKRSTKRENSKLYALTYVLTPLEIHPIRRQNN